MRAPKSVDLKLNLPFVQISGTWEPNTVERTAAWELYIEVITRVAVVPLDEDDGLLREALTSLHSLFTTTREILRRHGPAVAEPKRDGQYNLGYLAVALLNFSVRPLLTRWHPALEDWEAARPAGVSRLEHERSWTSRGQLQDDLASTRDVLAQYCAALATACGVPDLLAAVPDGRTDSQRRQQPGLS